MDKPFSYTAAYNKDQANIRPLPAKERNNERLRVAHTCDAPGDTPPRVLVLVGIPGSGKTTFARRLESEEWGERISQDDLGSRISCENAAVTALVEKRNIIIDRCNFDKMQRKHWVDYAKQRGSPTGVIVFGTPLEECLRRVRDRVDHPTLAGYGESDNVVYRMANSLQFPDRSEGFTFCRVIRTADDFDRVLALILDRR